MKNFIKVRPSEDSEKFHTYFRKNGNTVMVNHSKNLFMVFGNIESLKNDIMEMVHSTNLDDVLAANPLVFIFQHYRLLKSKEQKKKEILVQSC